MKKLVLVLAAVGLFGAMPVLAAEHGGMGMNSHEGAMMNTPDGVKECVAVADTIQTRVKRLETEIAKGEKKYSAEELKKLKNKLMETNKFLDDMYQP